MIFVLDGKQYSQYSGTWEKFLSASSWERVEYINIKPDYYKGEPLVLKPGEKGKIHYHYQFQEDLKDKKQEVEIKLRYKVGEKEEVINVKLERDKDSLYTENKNLDEHGE